MVNCLIQVSIEIIPNLGIGDSYQGFLEPEKIESYKVRMRTEVEETATELVNIMIAPSETTQTKEGLVLRLRPGRN